MIKKTIFVFAIALIVGSYVFSQEKMKLSLEDCIKYAQTHNNTLRTAELNRSSAELSYSESKQKFAPTVSASASQGFGYSHKSSEASWNGSYGISAGMTLFDGLNNYNSLKISELSMQQSDLKLEQSRNNINIQIIQAYLSILMNQEKLQYQQEVLKTAEEQEKEGKQQYAVGQILESDYKLLKANKISSEYDIENTKIAISNNMLSLKALLCIPSSTELEIEKPKLDADGEMLSMPTLNQAVEKALNYLPEVKLSQSNVDMANYDLKVAKSSFSPTLSLSAGINTGYTNFDEDWGTQVSQGLGENIGLNLSIPIYSRGSTSTKVKQSKISLQQANIDNEQVILDITEEIEQKYLSAAQSYNTYKSSEAMEKAYQESYNVYNEKFKAGSITTVELLQQQNNYLNSLNQYIQNKYSYLLNRRILDIYMGEFNTLN